MAKKQIVETKDAFKKVNGFDVHVFTPAAAKKDRTLTPTLLQFMENSYKEHHDAQVGRLLGKAKQDEAAWFIVASLAGSFTVLLVAYMHASGVLHATNNAEWYHYLMYLSMSGGWFYFGLWFLAQYFIIQPDLNRFHKQRLEVAKEIGGPLHKSDLSFYTGSNENILLYAAKPNGIVVGWISLNKKLPKADGDSCYDMSLPYVKLLHRDKGIDAMLINAAIRTVSAKGKSQITMMICEPDRYLSELAINNGFVHDEKLDCNVPVHGSSFGYSFSYPVGLTFYAFLQQTC